MRKSDQWFAKLFVYQTCSLRDPDIPHTGL